MIFHVLGHAQLAWQYLWVAETADGLQPLPRVLRGLQGAKFSQARLVVARLFNLNQHGHSLDHAQRLQIRKASQFPLGTNLRVGKAQCLKTRVAGNFFHQLKHPIK